MKVRYSSKKTLSPEAEALIQFDMDSIRQVVTSKHGAEPETWLVDPDSYEKDGRVHRDSLSSRLLAYSAADRVVYATDGCNTCARHLDSPLSNMNESTLERFASESELRLDLLKRLL